MVRRKRKMRILKIRIIERMIERASAKITRKRETKAK